MDKQSFARLNRESTKITVSEFFERHQLRKYNFDPEYQRRGDVWDEDKQAFLIDSILKNYPIPPIFLHQEIDERTGATLYNVIDGKQRLSAILKFINNELELPQDYDNGAFGDSRLNAKRFSDLEGELKEFKMQFWRYILSVEYIETNDLDIINNVFDRLNRNGVPLDPQELRKAKYFNTTLIKLVEQLATLIDWSKLGKVSVNRMQDLEFVSELIFLLLEKEPMDASSKDNIDIYYEKWSKQLTEEDALKVEGLFEQCISFINNIQIDFDKYKIKGVSHYYALFGLAFYCIEKNIHVNKINSEIDKFYEILRDPKAINGNVQEYKDSMQSNTRSKRQRVRRINALKTFFNI